MAGAELQDILERVQRLEDIEAIRNLKTAYALAADDRQGFSVNLERAIPLFATNGAWESARFGRAQGREAVRQFLKNAPARIDWSLHYLIDASIEVARDRSSARGRWYLFETARMVNPKTAIPEMVWLAGVYDDEFVREEGKWKFSLVKLDIQKIVGQTGVWEEAPVSRESG